jgi:hypothetical protein
VHRGWFMDYKIQQSDDRSGSVIAIG